MTQFLQIIVILTTGIITGILLCRFYFYKDVIDMKQSADDIADWNEELAGMSIRTKEWPADPEEYLEFHSLTRDDGIIEISFEGMENHLIGYSYHMLTRQKRDFMKMCKQLKNGDKILEKIGGANE